MATASRSDCIGSRSRDELLAHETLVARGHDRLQDGRDVQLLAVVHLVAAGHAGNVIMADVLVELLDPRDDVALHDLHVVDVEEDLHPRRADLLADLGGPLDPVALVVGMAFHLDVHPAVEHLDAQVDLLLLGIADDLLESFDRVLDAQRRRECPCEGRRK